MHDNDKDRQAAAGARALCHAILTRLEDREPDWSAVARLAGSLERSALRQARLTRPIEDRDVRIVGE